MGMKEGEEPTECVPLCEVREVKRDSSGEIILEAGRHGNFSLRPGLGLEQEADIQNKDWAAVLRKAQARAVAPQSRSAEELVGAVGCHSESTRAMCSISALHAGR